MTMPDPQSVTQTRSADSAAAESVADSAALIRTSEAGDLPTSFGVFKPVGYVMTGVPTQAQLDALVSALHSAGWPAPDVRQFSPQESVAELRTMVDSAGPLAGFGYEITLLKRYLALAEAGTQWLLVRAEDSERAASVAEEARHCGATLAVYYRTLTIEELIP